VPKDHTGIVESIRVVHSTRASAVTARTAAINEFAQMVITASAALRESLTGLSRSAQLATARRWRPGKDRTDPTVATKLALHRLAHRIANHDVEIADADADLKALVSTAAPALLALRGVGPETAATLLIAAGQNVDRFAGEAAFAMFCGAAPLPASSGNTHRHRLNRGGHRQANRALYVITLSRLRYHPATQAYRERQRANGKTNREIIRNIKRYLARAIYPVLHAALTP
jgi:transposase